MLACDFLRRSLRAVLLSFWCEDIFCKKLSAVLGGGNLHHHHGLQAVSRVLHVRPFVLQRPPVQSLSQKNLSTAGFKGFLHQHSCLKNLPTHFERSQITFLQPLQAAASQLEHVKCAGVNVWPHPAVVLDETSSKLVPAAAL